MSPPGRVGHDVGLTLLIPPYPWPATSLANAAAIVAPLKQGGVLGSGEMADGKPVIECGQSGRASHTAWPCMVGQCWLGRWRAVMVRCLRRASKPSAGTSPVLATTLH